MTKLLQGHNLGNNPIVKPVYEGIRNILIPRNITSTINGYKITTNYAMGGISRAIVEEHSFEPLATKLFIENTHKRIGDIIDVGANIGYYTLLAAQLLQQESKGYKVHAFEPESKNFSNLSNNVSLNDFTNVEKYNLALSDKKGKAKLYTSKIESGEHNITGSHNLKDNSCEISTTTLDELWYSKGTKQIRVIKIDVEGAECKVLSGASRTLTHNHPTMFIECWEEGLKTDNKSIEALLNALNFLGYRDINIIDEFNNTVYKATPKLIRDYNEIHKFSVNLIAK
jgi:FkbM family methyltransferase